MKKLGSALTAMIAMMLLCTATATAALYDEWDQPEQEVFELVNLQRSHNGMNALVADSRLQTSADLHSQDMALNDFFSHTGSDGRWFADRISAQGYDWTMCAENIAAGYTSAHSVMYGTENLELLSNFDINLGHDGFADWDEVGQGWTGNDWEAWDDQYGGGWMGSTGHRENILEAGLTDLGVGYYYLGNSHYHHYWTEDFATGDTVDPPPAVPVPAAIWLLGSGLVGLVGFRRHTQ